MATYAATRTGAPHNPAARQAVDAQEEAEAREFAADDYEHWCDWLDQARDGIDRAGGDCEDLDSLLACILQHVAAETETAVKAAEERASEYSRHVLRLAESSNHDISKVLRQQRIAKEEREIEGQALAARLDRMNDAIMALAKENGGLRAKLVACEDNLSKATTMLENEISRERALRRLLDSRRDRPNRQKVASELARRHAEAVLKGAEGRTEAA